MKNKILLISIIAMLVVGLVVGGCAKPAPTKVIEWKCQSLYPAEDLCHKVKATTIVNTINERLAGRLHVELFLPDMLVPVPEQIEACGKGVFELNMTACAFDAQWIPEAMVAFSLPASWENLEQSQKFFHEYGGLDFFRESYAPHNHYFLRQLPYGHNTLMTKERINELSDIKGMKIWVEPPQSYPVRDLGGSPTFMPLEDLYMALKLGTLDGCVYSEPELKYLSLYEVVNYIYHPSIQEVINVDITVNLDAWNSLPPDIQDEIEAIMDEINPQMCRAIMAEEAVGQEFFKEHGGTVVDFTPAQAAEVRRISRGSWDEIGATSPRAAQAVEMLRNFLKAEGID